MFFPRIEFSKIALEEENHSKEFVDEALDYAFELEKKGLPVIFSTPHLSMLVGLKFEKLLEIINNRKDNYAYYEIKKKKGGLRPIASPHRGLKFMQKWILCNILSKIPIHQNAMGFTPKKSILDNALIHINQDNILNIDLLKFFESINERRVYGIFKAIGYHPNLAVDLAKICTINPKYSEQKKWDSKTKKALKFVMGRPILPQGAPTSPILSNLVARRLDFRLASFAKKNNLKYSRYADDMTFSWNGNSKFKRSTIYKIIKEENFAINYSKIRYYGQSSNKRIVTGLLVSNKVTVPKKIKHEIKRHLYFCKKLGVENHVTYLDNKYKDQKFGYFKEWLEGKIRFIYMIEPEVGKNMFEEFNSIEWGI